MSDRDPINAPAPSGGPGETGKKSGRMGWVLKSVLVLSLALNLLIVGVVAGAAWRGIGKEQTLRRPPPPRAAMMIGGAVFRDLDRSERRKVRELAEGEFGSVFKRRRAEVETLLSLIGAEELDLDRLTATLEAQRFRSAQIEGTLESLWVARLQDMSRNDRMEVVDRVRRRMERGGSPKGEHKGPKGGHSDRPKP